MTEFCDARISLEGYAMPCGAPLPRENCPARRFDCPHFESFKPVVSGVEPMWYHSGENPSEPEPAELLTEAERALVSKLGQCAGDFSQIMEQGPNRGNDLIEMVHHIHALQNMVLAQAAARAYPDLYRRRGASIR